MLGWEFTEGTEEFGGYTTALVNGRGAAGMAPPMNGEEGAPTFWTVYLATADSAATEAAIAAAGGQVIAPTMTLGDLGAMGIYADPTGAVFGTWQSGSHTGYDVANEPGAVAWCEAALGDFDAGKSFYTDVFGYSYLDMSGPGVAYAMFSVPEGDRPAGDLPQQGRAGAMPADAERHAGCVDGHAVGSHPAADLPGAVHPSHGEQQCGHPATDLGTRPFLRRGRAEPGSTVAGGKFRKDHQEQRRRTELDHSAYRR